MNEYDEGTMAVSVRTFNKCSIVLPNISTDCRGVENWCCIIVTSSCGMEYVNVERYLTEHQ